MLFKKLWGHSWLFAFLGRGLYLIGLIQECQQIRYSVEVKLVFDLSYSIENNLVMFRITVYFKFIFLFFFLSLNASAFDCNKWFQENKIKKSDKSCLDKCVTLQADMQSYMCNLQCEHYCQSKCKTAPYWKDKLQDVRPKNWALNSEVSKSWTTEEQNKILEILNKLPDHFQTLSIDGIYRMKKSVQIINPGTVQNNSVVLYDNAFNDPPFNLEKVLIHELSHVLYNKLSKQEKQDYNLHLGWKEQVGEYHREGEFINTKAEDSPEEDFANNIEVLLTEPELLKSKVPAAYNWLIKVFTKDFKLSERCSNEK